MDCDEEKNSTAFCPGPGLTPLPRQAAVHTHGWAVCVEVGEFSARTFSETYMLPGAQLLVNNNAGRGGSDQSFKPSLIIPRMHGQGRRRSTR